MENIKIQSGGDKFSPFKQEDKFYFGGFFNLANNNISDFFKEITNRFGVFITDDESNSSNKDQEKTSEKIICEIFKNDISIVDYEKWVKIFADYFPSTKYLDDTQKTLKDRIVYFRDTMIKILKTVEILRNYYTHYNHSEIEINNEVFRFLDKVLLDVALTVKNKYLKTDKTKEFLNQHIKEELEELYELRKNDLYKKHKKNNKEEIINGIYNNAFKDFICKKKNEEKKLQKKAEESDITVWELCSKSSSEYNEKNSPRRNEGDLEIPISQKGIVFLLSFFLNKEEIYKLTSNMEGFKAKIIKGEKVTERKNSICYMATHRIFSFLAYKGLKRKIRTSEIDQQGDTTIANDSSTYRYETLMLQMLDELSKVPDVIYQNLNENLQISFIEDWNEYLKENNGNVATMEEERVIHPVIRKRYEDKFNYFAIRFLDEFANFPTLRFQVHLGNYLCDKRTKKACEVTTEREVKKKITVFGRLSEMEYKKALFLTDKTENQGWEVFPNPSYDFPKENISVNDKKISIDKALDREKQPLSNKIGIKVKIAETLQKEVDEAIKKANRNQDKKKKEKLVSEIVNINNTYGEKSVVFIGQPTAYLSMNDIHSLLYEFLKKGTSGADLEKKIVAKIESQIEQIIKKDTQTKILKPYQESTQNLINKEKLQKDLEQEEKILKILIQKQREKEKQSEDSKRKYVLYPSEKGKIAVCLANDIKRFMPENFKQQWRGYHHSLLQKYLAYYEQSKEEISTLLEGCKFSKLPFDINTLLENNSLELFYSAYLKERKKQISGLLCNIKNNTDEKIAKKYQKEIFNFFKKQNYVVNRLDEQIQSVLGNPVFIERGFLDDKPTMIEGKSFEGNENLFADWFVYYKKHTKEEYQKFYDVQLYPLKEVERKQEIKRNKQINKQKKNDVYTLLMAQYLLKKIFGEKFIENNPLLLKGIFQSKAERQQNDIHAASTQERNLNGILNQPVAIKILGKILVRDVKLKDIGNFRKYEIDQRVATFLDYEPKKEWMAYLPNDWKEKEKQEQLPSNNFIDRQISKYETVRSKVLLKDVQELERIIFERVEDKNILKKGKYDNFKYYIVRGLLECIKGKRREDLKVFTLNSNPETVDINQLNQNASDWEQKAFVLTYIRNKFAHNQLPKREFWDYCQEKYGKLDEGKSYAEYFAEIFKKVKNEFI